TAKHPWPLGTARRVRARTRRARHETLPTGPVGRCGHGLVTEGAPTASRWPACDRAEPGEAVMGYDIMAVGGGLGGRCPRHRPSADGARNVPLIEAWPDYADPGGPYRAGRRRPNP